MDPHAPHYVRRLERLLGLFALLLVLSGCKKQDSSRALPQLSVEDSRGYLERRGFFQMVPPLRLPLRSRQHRVEVWLKLPDDGPLTIKEVGQRALLSLPVGTEAARVEGTEVGDREVSILDVRGTRFLPDGELFFVLRATRRGRHPPLGGVSWHRGSEREQKLATEAVVELSSVGATGEAKRRAQKAAQRNNDCAGCHQHARPENRAFREHGVANRGTDESGCYQIQGVLSSRQPLETYFPVETNLDDPFIRFSCGDEPASVDREHGKVSCPDRSVPRGTLDVRSALARSDPHARAVCASRRYLFDHADAATRRMFREGFEECGIFETNQPNP